MNYLIFIINIILLFNFFSCRKQIEKNNYNELIGHWVEESNVDNSDPLFFQISKDRNKFKLALNYIIEIQFHYNINIINEKNNQYKILENDRVIMIIELIDNRKFRIIKPPKIIVEENGKTGPNIVEKNKIFVKTEKALFDAFDIN